MAESVFADDLYHVLNALDLPPVYLAGRCSGQTASFIAALRHPDAVKGLVLVGPPVDDPDEPRIAHYPPASSSENLIFPSTTISLPVST